MVKLDDILKYAVERGMIDMSSVQRQIEMDKRQELLKQHPYRIWQGKDGRYRTYIADSSSKYGRKLIVKSKLADIENLIIGMFEQQEDNPTVHEIFTQWNDYRLELRKIAPATHTRNINVFKRHYTEFGKQKIKQVTKDDFIDFLERQISQYELTAKGFSNLKSITKGLIKRAYRKKYIDYDGHEVINALDVSDKEFARKIHEDYEEVFSEEEMQLFLDYLIKHDSVRDIPILLMFITGMRIGEVSTLKPCDIGEVSIKVRRTETTYKDENGKRIVGVKDFPKTLAGVRNIVVPKEYLWVLERIREISAGQEYVFVNELGRRVSSEKIRRHMDRVLKKLNIYHKSPHKIRKTYGTILLDYNVDQRFILEQMGHSNIKVSENYYHRNRKSLERKMDIISAIPDFQNTKEQCIQEVIQV